VRRHQPGAAAQARQHPFVQRQGRDGLLGRLDSHQPACGPARDGVTRLESHAVIMPLNCRYAKTIPADVLHGWPAGGAGTDTAGKWPRPGRPMAKDGKRATVAEPTQGSKITCPRPVGKIYCPARMARWKIPTQPGRQASSLFPWERLYEWPSISAAVRAVFK